jgi:DNA-binding XRE family transcriptional regulator
MKGGEPMKYTMKQARQLAGLTQAEMAYRIGVSCTTYRSYEKAPCRVRAEMIVRFSKALKIPFEDIVTVRDDSLELTEEGPE